MKMVGGVYLPDGEKHLVEWMRERNHAVAGRLTYQFHKLDAAMALVTQWRGAVDVGAHCGLWSMHLAARFVRLWAFEPIAEHRECFKANLALVGATNYELLPVACGRAPGTAELRTAPTSSGDTYVDVISSGAPDGAAAGANAVRAGVTIAPLVRLDAVLDLSAPVDFIKLDLEGFELFALEGARALLQRWHPVVCVEQKPGKAERYGRPRTGAVDFLQQLGAKLRAELSGDFILSW